MPPRKNSPLEEKPCRNLEQNQGLGGQPFASTGWVERESNGERQTTTVITVRIII